jgi:ArsR family transcriptional regulator, arsenate/arsenite/antimonite-responsive transcriptional repressor
MASMSVDALEETVDKASGCVNMCRVPRSSPPLRLPVLPCCTPLSAEPLPRLTAKRLAGSFRALADPARLRLLSLIQAQPKGEACVCNLVEPLGLSQPTVTHHLQVLHRAGLLERERRGVWVYYRVVREALDGLRAALG